MVDNQWINTILASHIKLLETEPRWRIRNKTTMKAIESRSTLQRYLSFSGHVQDGFYRCEGYQLKTRNINIIVFFYLQGVVNYNWVPVLWNKNLWGEWYRKDWYTVLRYCCRFPHPWRTLGTLGRWRVVFFLFSKSWHFVILIAFFTWDC